MNHQDAALVIAGHGSTLNADSSAPTYLHAETIRGRGLFAEVHECFWKEEPNFRRVLHGVKANKVYLVPNFISSGYFTEEVIPREFGLTGPISSVGEQEIFYCDPVGLHSDMSLVLWQRATEVVEKSGTTLERPEESTCLFLVGHGTGLNENSKRVVFDQTKALASRGVYAECRAAFMEEAPRIQDWRQLTRLPNVIVVPFFISDGLHSFEDVPVLLGMTNHGKKFGGQNPHRMDGRSLWYANAIGTSPLIAEVILDQVKKFDREWLNSPCPVETK